MQEQPPVQKIAGLVNTLRDSPNKTQASCCMNELSAILDTSDLELIEEIDDKDVHKVVLAAMEHHVSDVEIQRDGIYCLYHLMENNKEMQNNLITLRMPYIILQLMSRYPDETIIQAIGCRIINILIQLNYQTLQDTIAMQAVDTISKAMENFDNEDDLQLWAMQALTNLLKEQPKEQHSFLQKQYFLLVLDRSEKLLEYSEIVQQGLELLTVLAESSHFLDYFTESETSAVLQLMTYHQDCSDVQNVGCTLLLDLVKSDKFHEPLMNNDVDLVILRAMEKHTNREAIQIKCMEFIQLMCTSLLDILPEDQKVHKVLQWLDGIMIAMSTHCDDCSVLISACDTLTALTCQYPEIMSLIDDEPDNTPVHNAVMAALVLHIDDAIVCEATCKVIACIALHSDTIKQALFEKGVYMYIIKAMKKHDQVSGVQQFACQSLRLLCLPSVENMKVLVLNDAWDRITECISNFQENAEVLLEAIAIVAYLATDLEIIRNQCAVESLHLPILAAIRAYPKNEILVEVALEAIGVLAACEAMPHLLIREGVTKTFLDALSQHLNCLGIQQKGCILVQIFSSYLNDEWCIDAVRSVILAMQHFPKDECVQAEGCVALNLIAQFSPNYSETLVNQCAHERLFAILDKFRNKRKLIELASGVLWFLARTRQLTSRMLLSACAGGLIRGAHCLIQLGANVNIGEGYNTPLCSACKNNKEKMVRFLLTQGITDVNTALNLCLEMEHHNLVGILLQKMGHDREAGIVSWNGLNLGSVRPEWLLPSLAGSAFGLSIETERYCNYLQFAERAFEQRFKVLEMCTNLASRGIVDGQKMQESIVKEFSDDEVSDDEFLYPTSDEGSWEDSMLSQKSPVRATTLSGAALPYSSYDPRVVLPLCVGDPILLPRRIQPETPNSASNKTASSIINVSMTRDYSWRMRSKSLYDNPNVPILEETEDAGTKVRTHSDVGKPTFELTGVAFMYNTPHKRKNRSNSENSEQDAEDGESFLLTCGSSRRLGRRKTTFSSKGQTNARVCALDVSGNRISDLESLVSVNDSSILPYMTNVEKLDLSHNHLTNLPSDFCEAMPNLRQAILTHNNLTEFPFILTKSRRLKKLDLSFNDLQLQEDCPADASKAVLLEHLSLASNDLTTFPQWLSDVFPGLTFLSVADNKLEIFPETSERLQCLKTLDVSKNKIVRIPDSFLDQFRALDTLNASHNELSSLPELQTDCDSQLTTLRLAHNNLTEEKPFFIPRFILRLPRLRTLDLSHNKLTCLPPFEIWKTTHLKELNVSDNSIRRIDLDTVNPSSWRSLERLNLGNNNLKDVPKGIGFLTSLTSLDLSNNSEIRSLPDEIGRLSNLWDFQLTGLRLDLEESLLANTKKLVAFFNSKLMNSVPYYRMKLVTIGLEKRGKTTLLNQLLKSKSSNPQNELVIRDWQLRDCKATCKQCHHKSVIYTINTWDMKGREDLYQAFQTLMTSRTLYLAVYDITNGGEEFAALRPWLQTIYTCAPDVPVMLVGTHLDRVPKDSMDEVLEQMKNRARVLFTSPGLPDIKAHFVLNCTEETPGIQSLRNKIVELVVKCKCKGHSILGSRVPQKFVKLQEIIEKAVNDSNGNQRVMKRSELKKLLLENDVTMSESELGQSVKFLHEAGVFLHYDDPVAQLNDLFFVDPVWLSNVVSSVVSPRKLSGLVTNGIVKENDLISFLKDDDKSTIVNIRPQMLRLLERFGVLLPITDSEYLVSSRLPPEPPSTVYLPDLTSNRFYRRFYKMAFVPLGFWSRLITRLLLFLPMMDSVSEEGNDTPSKDYWQSGIEIRWSDHSYFTVFQDTSNRFGANIIAIVVPTNDYGSYLLSNLVDHVDVLIEEWFADMCELDPVQGLPQVTRFCPCIKCEGDDCHVFELEECIQHALRYEELTCSKTSELLPVVKVAPDVELADLKLKNLLIKDNELILEQKREFVLGDGGFGSVYKATCNDRVVAVKVFHTEGHINPHRLLRQEVPFLANLSHPSIIKLHGVCVRPRALVLEVAPLGSLSSLLNKGEPLSRGLQHRIALQVAEGLAYLHRFMIVYRDLKPHNILIFSLSLSIVINAKISDFGIARYTPLYGLKSSEGTPGYRAPEVVRGDIAYNKAADLYSFGMLLYELVTGGRRPFEELRFRNELDAAVMQGRMIDPITADNGSSPWPDVEDLIEHLLEPQADQRPTAEQVVERLSSAELLCLKRVIAVSKERAVECISVKTNDEDIELWMGSGVAGNFMHAGQISWLSLTNATNEGCQGTGVADKRVTSMLTINRNRILVGTQSGLLWVFDAQSHTCLHSLKCLPDSVVSLRHYSNTFEDLVFVGLANGSLVIYQTKDIEKQDTAPREIIKLCKTQKDDGECLDDCNLHPVSCLAIGKKCLYCACGNDVVVFKLLNNSVVFKRRWSVEDRHKESVLNIAVGKSICTSTKDSPLLDFWNMSEPVLLDTVDCTKIVNGASRDIRVVCMLLQDQDRLWVGLGTGHVIILSLQTRETLYVIKRHTGSVRCMAVARRNSSLGRPVSLVMTGGMNFIERPGSHRKEQDFGHVLVWQADLVEQSKRLHSDKIKRENMPTD